VANTLHHNAYALLSVETTSCARARPRTSNSLARFSLHGINGLPDRSNTKTATTILSTLIAGNRRLGTAYTTAASQQRPYGPCYVASRRSPFDHVAQQL
jgi:hypothetical protein